MQIFRLISLVAVFCGFISFSQLVLAQNVITSIEPVNYEKKFSNQVLLHWNNNSHKTPSNDYQLRIGTDGNLNNLLIDTLLNLEDSLLVTLGPGRYYWGVRLVESSVEIAASDTFVFSVIDIFDLTNTSLWLRADTGVIVNGSSELISWENLANPSNPAVQTTTGLQPLLVSADMNLNGRSTVNFDGNDDLLLINNPVTIGEIFIVFDWAGGGAVFPDYNGLLTGQTTNIGLIATGATSNFYNFGVFATNISINGTMSMNMSPIDKYKLVDATRTSGFAFPDLQIGKDRLNATRHWNGNIAEMLAFSSIVSDSIKDVVKEYFCDRYVEPFRLGEDIKVVSQYCDTVIYVDDSYQSYLWSDGSTGDSIAIIGEGTYYVTVTGELGCVFTDDFNVYYPSANYPLSEVLICEEDSMVWTADLRSDLFNFQWNTGQTDSLITIDSAGQYWVTVTDNFGCYRISDTLTVTVDSFPITASLGDDITMCSGNFIGLKDGAQETQSYSWNTLETSNMIQINSSGIYHVSLTNVNSCFARDTIDINIQGDAPNAQFSVANACVYDSTFFVDQSTPNDASNIVQWQWDLGNGTISSQQHPIVKYGLPTTFTAALTVTTDSGCSQYTSGFLEVYPIPQSQLNVLNTIFCSGDQVGFRPDSLAYAQSWILDFGDVSQPTMTSENQDTIQHIYNSAGEFSITLITQSDQGCVDTMYSMVSIDESPNANFDYQRDCEGEPVQFVDQTEGANNGWSWKWKFGNGQTQTGQVPNPANTYAQAGIYNVTMSLVDHNGCQDEIVKQIEVSENPVADFYVTDFCLFTPIQVFDSTYSADSIVTWNWDVINHSNLSNLQNPYFNFTYLNPNTYNLKLSVVTDVGCVDEVTKTITVHEQPIADFSFSPEFGGAPLEVEYTNTSTSGYTYQWSFGTGDTSTDENPLYTYQENNIYDIQLITFNEFGCADTAYDFIKITPPILDMAVSKVYTNTIYDDAYLQVTADLVNLGTREVNTFDLIATTSNGANILEQWNGQLYTLDGETYLFNAAFELTDGQLPNSVCVKLVDPNGETDDVPSNNEYCISLDEFIVFEPYPNPANDVLNVEFVLPEKGQVYIVIYNAIGQHIRTLNSYDGVKGVNRLSLRIDGLSADVYSLVIQYQDQSALKKFIRIDQE